MRRLRRYAGMMALPVPVSDADVLGRVRDTLKAAELGAPGCEAYIRILVTRGIGEISYDPAACPDSSVVIIVKPHAELPETVYDKGVKVVIVSIVRNHPGTVNPMIKSNNLLNNALAMQQALKRGGIEALMKNYRGEISECAQSNFFLVKDGVALTPRLETGLLRGVTRDFIFDLGREVDVPVREAVLFDGDVYGADEAFITSTTREVHPVVTVDDKPVGAGVPGPITKQLMAAFRGAAQRLTKR
jgi:branched-chain amino acid aminotransferase